MTNTQNQEKRKKLPFQMTNTKLSGISAGVSPYDESWDDCTRVAPKGQFKTQNNLNQELAGIKKGCNYNDDCGFTGITESRVIYLCPTCKAKLSQHLEDRKIFEEMLDKWWNGLQKGNIDEFDVVYAEVYADDFEELKQQLKEK